MGTVLASVILRRFSGLLQDDDHIHWGTPEFLDWLNDAQNEAVILKPNVSVRNGAVQLAEGTLQSIPSDAIALMKVVRNRGTGGTTPGRAITHTDMAKLDQQAPDWHSAKADATVKHYMFDVLDPKHFYVYPPQPAINRGYVDLICSVNPAPVTGLTDTIKIDDVYQNALLDYCLYRALSKDTENAADIGRADSHYNKFAVAMGARAQGDVALNPNPKPARN